MHSARPLNQKGRLLPRARSKRLPSAEAELYRAGRLAVLAKERPRLLHQCRSLWVCGSNSARKISTNPVCSRAATFLASDRAPDRPRSTPSAAGTNACSLLEQESGAELLLDIFLSTRWSSPMLTYSPSLSSWVCPAAASPGGACGGMGQPAGYQRGFGRAKKAMRLPRQPGLV